MLTVRCSHLYWGQPGPCRAKQWALGSDERQEREPEQSREECGVTRAHSAPHSGVYWTMGHISAFRNRRPIPQDNSLSRISLDLVEMNQAADAWSLRPHSDLGLAWTVTSGQPSSTQHQAPAQVSLGPVATTLHTDTARNGSHQPPAASWWHGVTSSVYFVNRMSERVVEMNWIMPWAMTLWTFLSETLMRLCIRSFSL